MIVVWCKSNRQSQNRLIEASAVAPCVVRKMFRLCAPHWWCALATAALAVARPPPLAPRNAVTACVSPASPVAYLDSFVSRDAFARHAQRNALGVGGWHATFGAHAFDATDYLAGTDAQRASDFNKALTNDSVRAVVATRGGYGCARLLPLLDCAAFARAPKRTCAGRHAPYAAAV
mmetsp:Transcript_50819/g.124836  ORF Transcript_50819/g.124836 Transcript_50819/m.124836 type:complete len:176 (+) Transcript_50819:816-1343(+)